VLAGIHKKDNHIDQYSNLRIGLPADHFQENLHPDVRRILENVVALLRDAGVQVIPADIPGITALNAAVSLPVVLYETPAALREFLAVTGLQLSLEDLHDSIASPDVKALVGMAMRGQVSREAYELALNTHRPRLQQAYRDYFATHRLDAVLFPTTPLPASLIATSDASVLLNGNPVPTFATYIQNTDPASNAGIPGLSIPAGFSEHGLPIGVELDGPEGSDRHLLAVGAAVEANINTNKSNSAG
jgi:mandelamide amidase